MVEFQVPEDLGDIKALQTQDCGRFCISQNIPILRDESAEQLNDRLDDLSSRLGGGEPAVLSEQDNFDDIFAFVSDFKYLPSKIKGRVLRILCEGLSRLVPVLGGEGCQDEYTREERGAGEPPGQASLALRNTFKMAVYLLFSASHPAEEVYSRKQNESLEKPSKGPGSRGGKKARATGSEFEWDEARDTVLDSMRLALTVDPARLWSQGVPDRCFMLLFLRLACKMLELPETVKTGMHNKLSRGGRAALELLSGPFRLAQGMESEVSAATFMLVREHKHMPAAIARLCQQMVEKHGDARLGAELVREIGRMDMPNTSIKNTAAAAPVINVSNFLRELALVLPGTVHAHASILLPHLSSRPYQIRNAVVFALVEIITAAHTDRKVVENVEDGQEGSVSTSKDSERDVQVDPRRVRMTDRNRNALFDQLVERALDVSPFVRLSVLRGWAVITEREALPRKRYLIAARLGTDRLRDQASLVRKESARLLTTLLEFNPYNSTLDLEINQQTKNRAEAELRAMSPLDSDGKRTGENILECSPSKPSGVDESDDTGSDEEGSTEREDDDASDASETDTNHGNGEDDSGSGGEGDEKPLGGRDHQVAEDGGGEHSQAPEGAGEEPTEEMKARVAKAAQCDHLSAAVMFIEELQVAETRMREMIGSKTTTDVVEALRFFVTACHFHLPGALEEIKKSLTLIWRAEGSIEAETKRAFVEVFVQPAKTDDAGTREALPAQQVARNLVELVNESKPGELTSLEEVISSLVKDMLDPEKDSPLDPEVFEQLWCMVTTRGQATSHRAGALHAIAMGASANPSLVNNADKLGIIRETALGRSVMENRDWRTVRCACVALLRYKPEPGEKTKETEFILKRLGYFLQGKWCVHVMLKSSEKERAAAEEEMKNWFAAAEQAVAVLFHLSSRPEELGATIVRAMATQTLSSDLASPFALARLCFVLGHLAIKLLVYVEDLAGRLQRGRAKIKTTKDAKTSGEPNKSVESESEDKDDEDDVAAQELGMTAEALAEDEQRLAELIEKDIVGRNLLGAFGPVLVRIVANVGGLFDHPLIRQSSVLALSKFMCISGTFCERHLNLLFTVMEREKNHAVRSNVVVALGDLAFRFPNALEPWNPKIYARLRDGCPRVRANAIMVLTHLILNDMVKVKGQVSELALCIVDDESRIADAAKTFFHRYSERGQNPIYNILPDIVGRLSADESVSSSDFHIIMDFLMKYVIKDKLTELLAEKLCARLSATEGVRQSRAVSYCIGQLKLTEKAVVRLTELVPSYKEPLRDEKVYANFAALVSRTKKLASLEMQEALSEWETQLKKYHEDGAADEDAAARAEQAKNRRGSKRVSSISNGTRASRGEATTTKAATRSRTRRGKCKVVPPDTSSEDQEDDTGDERENIDELRRRNSDVSEDEGREMPRRSKVSNKALSKMKEKDVEASEAEGGNVVDWGSDEDVFEPVAKQSGTKSRTMKNVKLASRRPRRVVSPLSPAN